MIIKSKIDNLKIIWLNKLETVNIDEVVEVPFHIYRQYMYTQWVECLSHITDGLFIRYIVEAIRDINLHLGSEINTLKMGDKVLVSESEARIYIQMWFVKGSTDKYLLAWETILADETTEAEKTQAPIKTNTEVKKNTNTKKITKKWKKS